MQVSIAAHSSVRGTPVARRDYSERQEPYDRGFANCGPVLKIAKDGNAGIIRKLESILKHQVKCGPRRRWHFT